MVDIDVSGAVRRPGEWFSFDYEGDPQYKEIELAAPLTLRGEFGCFDDTVKIRGSMHAELAEECARCLAPATCPIDASFEETFVPGTGNEDAYNYNRETKRVSLDQMIYDLLQTETPIQILCREDCAGLCPVCGQNLNVGVCDCEPERPPAEAVPEGPFAKLKDVF